MAELWTFKANGKYGVADSRHVQSPATVRSSEVHHNTSRYHAPGHKRKQTCPLANAFAMFLWDKIGMSRDNINYLNWADLVWDLVSFVHCSSMGTTYDVAQRLGLAFCIEFPIEVVEMGTLFEYFKQYLLEMNMELPVFTSFERKKWLSFKQMNHKEIWKRWGDGIYRLYLEIEDSATNDQECNSISPFQ